MVKSFKTFFGSRPKRRWFGTMSAGREEPENRSWRLDRVKVALMLLTVAALSVVMSVRLGYDHIALRLGDISPREVRAGRSVFYVDTVKTAQLQEAALNDVRLVYDVDDNAVVAARRTVEQLFDRIRAERAPLLDHRLNSKLLKTALADSQFASLLKRPTLIHVLTVPGVVFQKLHDTTARLVKEAMDREIRNNPDDLPQARQFLNSEINSALPDPLDNSVARMVAEKALRPTRLFNPRKTLAAREQAIHAVSPVVERLVLGETIVGVGKVVTAEDLDKLKALGLVDPRQQLTNSFAVCLLSAFMVLLVVFYIQRSLPKLYDDNRRLTLLAVIVLMSVVGLKAGSTLLGISAEGGQLGYVGMMSVAAAGMLVSVMLDMNLALLIVALLSVQSGILMNHEIRFTVLTLMSSLIGIASVRSCRRTNNLPTVTGWLSVGNVGMVWLLGLLFSDTRTELLLATAWAIGTAGLTTFLFWFGLLVLEKPFGILTHTALLEMSAFDRPLLQQLCAVAPGTYAHSMMVGTLAEAAAQAISADALLCRVAGYYHDIGKINRPDFFIENQRQENAHARLSPSLSALIIIAHVRDGVEMAREHRLPLEIRDIIAQHHGTTLISYFYHQALTDNAAGAAPPDLEARFRYPGPKPQTAEAAIVMLADSVEAAARCIDKPDEDNLQELISRIVRGKIEDGQLDACPLTFACVKQISDAFLHVLLAMNHGRINYPKEAPRTGSGQPMEVRRADLRPEPLPRPVAETTDSLRDLSEIALDGLSQPLGGIDLTTIDSEAGREIVAHLGLGCGVNAFSVTHRDERAEEHEMDPVARLPFHETGAATRTRAVPLVQSEVVYGHYSSEQPDASGADEADVASDPAPAPPLRHGTRRDQHSIDR